MSVGQIGDNMTPLREIVKALTKISEGPWKYTRVSSISHGVDIGETQTVYLNRAEDGSFIASSPRWLAETVVRVVDERAVLCARKQQSSWLWDEWSSPAQKRFIGQALRDEGIAPDDFAWLKGKVRG